MNEEIMLRCSRCEETKSILEFSKAEANTKRYKRSSYCKACSRKHSRKYYTENREFIISDQIARGRGSKLKQRYGITEQEYEELLEEQNGVCAICRNECSRNARLSVDHDHITGVVRGLLCDNCNVGLGRFKDSKVLVMNAALYLKNGGFSKLSVGSQENMPEMR